MTAIKIYRSRNLTRRPRWRSHDMAPSSHSKTVMSSLGNKIIRLWISRVCRNLSGGSRCRSLNRETTHAEDDLYCARVKIVALTHLAPRPNTDDHTDLADEVQKYF